MEKSVILKKNNPYKSTQHFHKIVKGNFSQSSIIFDGIGIGLQCVPNSVMLLIYNTLKPSHLWEAEDLDKVLQSGNILYNSIGKKTTLLVSDVPKYIKLHETIYFLNYENCTLGCIFQDNIVINSVQFSKLSSLLSKYKYFLLILSDSCVSVVNDNNTFWVFDPHSRNEEGFPSSSGTSILLHFKNFINFCAYIEEISKANNYKMYELTPVNITKLKQKKESQKETTLNYSQSISTNTPTSNKRKYKNEIPDEKIKKIKIEQNVEKDIELTKKLGYKFKQLKIITEDISKEKNRNLTIQKEILKKCKCNERIKKDEILCKEKGYKLPILNIHIRKLQNEQPKNKIKNNTSNVTKINKKTRENYGKNIEDSIKIFHTITKEGPIYVCSICQQINFLHNLSQIAKLKKKNKLLGECNTHYKAINNIEYICNTCKKYIYKNKVPKLSIKNGCGFNEKPEILDLFCLEERFISLVMAFMLIHQIFPGGQFLLEGGICHLPIEVAKVVNILPSKYSEFETIAVKLKRRLCYKNSVFSENIHPHKIIEALKYLINTSELYKDHNVNIDYEWLKLFNNNNRRKTNTKNEKIEIQKLNSSSDEDSETDETPNVPCINTLLTEKTNDPTTDILCIAPGEGQKPIFTDADTEYLCFPTIFCGKR